MFTFGREHEKKCEAAYVRKPEQVALLMAVVDTVHDLIEGGGDVDALVAALRRAFTLGGAGVWENAAKWLRKSGDDYPAVLKLWPEFASDARAEIRFRAACLLNDMPQDAFSSLSPLLLADRSKKVANMAANRVEERHGAR